MDDGIFTAPYGTILEPNKTYHVVVVPAGGTFSCKEQLGSGEDAGKAPGWSIIDRAWKVNRQGQSRGSFSMMACRVRIRGKAVPDAPHITDLSYSGSSLSAPIYETGSTVEVTVTFDEAVDVATSDPPVLPLEIGANTRNATYVAADSTTTKLVFGYTVVAGDRDDDGVTIGSDTLTGGITRAGTTVMADLDHAGDSNNRSVLVNAAPIVESVQVTSAAMLPGWYRAGEVIEITVTFSTSVTVTGDPEFRFRLGTGQVTGQFNRGAAYTASASAPNTMVFRYTVVVTDEDNDGIWIGNQSNTFQLDTNDAIKDGVRTSGKLDTVLTHAALGFLIDHKVSSRPRVLSVVVASDPRSGANSDTYGAGELIVITTTFSQLVTVPGDAPRFRFFMGPSSDPDQSVKRAAYDAGRSGMNKVVFTYTVVSGDEDTDGIWIGPSRRTIEGADRIQNGAGLASVRDHAEVGTLSGHKVDGSLTPPPSTAPLFPDTDVPMDGADAVSLPVDENAAEGTTVGTVVATDGNGDTLTYSVGGTDATAFAGVFSLDAGTGAITVKTGATPDYETKASYVISITVTDGEDAMGVAETGTPTTDDTVSVTITVTDVEETGVVALSPATPQVDTEATASVSDPDGSVSAVTWQWSKSDTANGAFTDITGETNAAYTPVAADLNKYLKATASYTDGRGSGKSAESTPAQVVGSLHTAPAFMDDDDPKDGADPITLTVDENSAAGTAVGTVVATDGDGDTLTYSVGGTDAAAFGSVFSLDTGTGAITVKTGATPDYETKASYSITVSVTDGEDAMGVAETGTPTADDTVSVTITVTDVEETGVVALAQATPRVDTEVTASVTDPDGSVSAVTWQWSKSDTANGTFTDISGATNAAYTPVAADLDKYLKASASYTDRRGSGKSAESTPAQVADVLRTAPAFPDADSNGTADPFTFTVAENSAAGTAVGTTTATDADGDSPIYSSSGTDATTFAGVFSLDTGTGAITVKTGATPDYETKSSYAITISVTDGENVMGTAETNVTTDDSVAVTITVTDVEEAGSISLSRTTPTVGVAIAATLTDPDGGETAITWQWAKSDTSDGTFTDITGATSDSYTPVAADVGKWLKVTASYTDSRGPSKTAVQTADNAVDSSPHKVPAFATETITLTVLENAAAGTSVGTVSATDADGDALKYRVSGTDITAFNADFTIDIDTGEIKVKTGGTIDYEDKDTYTVTVEVTDGEDASGTTENPAVIDDTITVTITVTNVDDAGTVTLPATPQVYVEQTASVTDPDGAITGLTWQWSKSDTADGTFDDINDATSAEYTPEPADQGKYLKATASYTDPQGSGKSAEAVATNAVGASPHTSPAFANDTETVTVDENLQEGNVVSRIRANDTDGDPLTYSVGGTDVAAFNQALEVVGTTGVIKIKPGATLDYESKSSYSITLNVTDG